MKHIVQALVLGFALLSFFSACSDEDNTQPIRLENENPQVIFDNDDLSLHL